MPNQKLDLYELGGRLGSIESKLDSIIKKLDDHDTRINCVEEGVSVMKGQQKGAAAVWGFIGGAVSVIITILAFFRRD
jgi:tetrahydromethanopterin S-methyltransferase subunit B